METKLDFMIFIDFSFDQAFIVLYPSLYLGQNVICKAMYIYWLLSRPISHL